jgi:hypothetical protein
VRAIPAVVVLLPFLALGPALAACGDSTGVERLILSDTLTVGVPGAAGNPASAIDLVRIAPPYTLLRRPEQIVDAQQWDFALRESGGGFALRPYAPEGGGLQNAGIARSSTDYDQLDNAPRGTGPYTYEAVAIAEGATYAVRSRQYGGGCAKYGKLKVVELDAAEGTARIALTLNDGCEDERLTP